MPRPPGRRLATALALLALALAGKASAQQAASASPPPPGKRELAINPVVGGDSDIGLAIGQLSSWARVADGPEGYAWRVETGAFVAFKYRDSLVVPLQDYYLLFSLPRIGPHDRLRLDVRLSFTARATLKFYGIGNASPEPPPGAGADQAEYGRSYPTMWLRARTRIYGPLELHLGGVGWYSWLDVPEGGILATAQTSGSPVVRDLIGSFAPHGVVLAEAGAIYDSRDNEVVTRHGGYHTVTVRISPAVTGQLPYPYQQLNGTARFYWTPLPWLTVTWRGVADLLLGQPPFYELERFEETSALGGVKGVRGVPAQRYYGKVKLLQNFEVRSDLWDFQIRRKDYVLGAAAFFDGGRVWTELGQRHPELDGRGVGLKYGVGGGLRLQQGKTFIVRLDLAWSPDANPIGAYFAAGQIF